MATDLNKYFEPITTEAAPPPSPTDRRMGTPGAEKRFVQLHAGGTRSQMRSLEFPQPIEPEQVLL